MNELWKVRLNNGLIKLGVMVMDVSKAFTGFNHEPLWPILKAYGLRTNTVTLMGSSLKSRLQHYKKDNSLIKLRELLDGFIQAFISGLLLFKISINTFFYFFKIMTFQTMLWTVLCKHMIETFLIPQWFHNDFMVLNSDECFIMSLGIDDELQPDLVCGSETLKNSKQEKVLGVTIDNRLNFATHFLNIAKNANIKFNTLIQKCLNTKQKN